jgi:hypothetical protein
MHVHLAPEGGDVEAAHGSSAPARWCAIRGSPSP